MSERWVPTQKGAHLAGRKKAGTEPELALRKAIHALGGRFRVNRTLAKACTPDIILPGRQVVVFVDGCFWHGCPIHGRKRPWEGPNAALWEVKMDRNARNDRQANRIAESLGWHVERVWECEVKKDAPRLASELLQRWPYQGPSGHAK